MDDSNTKIVLAFLKKKNKKKNEIFNFRIIIVLYIFVAFMLFLKKKKKESVQYLISSVAVCHSHIGARLSVCHVRLQ